MFKHIKGFGYELEGGWEEENFQVWEDKGIIKGDGSVDTELCNGEIASPVFKDLKEAWKFMNRVYPQAVNRTCGFHIHISVNETDYVILMERKFYDAFLTWAKELLEKHGSRLPKQYEPRLNGGNSYCLREFHPIHQVKNQGNRYTHLNYCYGRHKTMENRMFPGCKKAKNAFFMLTQYLIFVENYLKNNKLESKRHAFEVKVEKLSHKKIKKRIGEPQCA